MNENVFFFILARKFGEFPEESEKLFLSSRVREWEMALEVDCIPFSSEKLVMYEKKGRKSDNREAK